MNNLALFLVCFILGLIVGEIIVDLCYAFTTTFKPKYTMQLKHTAIPVSKHTVIVNGQEEVITVYKSMQQLYKELKQANPNKEYHFLSKVLSH